jgi:hypothetical protein
MGIFGTPDDPSNEAEQQAELDWVASPPDTVTAQEMSSWSQQEVDIYYDAGGEEP